MTAPADWTLKRPVRLYGVHKHARIDDRLLSWVYDDPRPVEWWIDQLFDGPNYELRSVWLVPDDCDPRGFVDVTARFAELVADQLRERDPDEWPADQVAFAERHRDAAITLQAARRSWAEFHRDQRIRAGW